MEPEVPARILVVDDDVEVQRMVKRAAEAAGFVVVQAFDGTPGLVLAAMEKFDLILLDINMPVADGRDVLSSLKKNPVTADIPVLVCSGRGVQGDRMVALELGAEDYVEKPIEASLLMMKIGHVVRRTRERRGEADKAPSRGHP
jgi:DNA-binding response OmpR family regulator